MKNIKQIALVLCIGVLMVFASCKKTGLPPQLRVIPSDAALVVSIENKQLIMKSGLNNITDFKFIQSLRDEMDFDDGVNAVFDEFLKNPESLGIDLDKSYFFVNAKDENFFIGFVFNMKNLTKFEENVNKIIEKWDYLKVENRNAYNFVIDDSGILAWNKEVVVAGMVDSDIATSQCDMLFNLPEGKCIASVPDFMDFCNRSFDVGLWGSYSSLLKNTSSFTKINIPENLNEFMDMNVHAYLNFDNGEMRLSYLMTPQSKITDFLKKYPIIKKQFDNKLLRPFPEKSYLVVKQSLNFQEYIKMIKDFDNSDISINEILNESEYGDIINGLGGDILFSLYGFAQGPFPIPLAGLAFNVNSNDDFDKMRTLIPRGMAKQNGDYYVVSTGLMVSVYFAFKDNVVFVTNDADAIVAFTGKGVDKAMNASNLSPFYINLDIDSYPENVRNALQSQLGVAAIEAMNYLKPYKDFTISVDDDFQTVFSLKFKDKSQNSLKQLLKSVDEISDL